MYQQSLNCTLLPKDTFWTRHCTMWSPKYRSIHTVSSGEVGEWSRWLLFATTVVEKWHSRWEICLGWLWVVKVFANSFSICWLDSSIQEQKDLIVIGAHLFGVSKCIALFHFHLRLRHTYKQGIFEQSLIWIVIDANMRSVLRMVNRWKCKYSLKHHGSPPTFESVFESSFNKTRGEESLRDALAEEFHS